MKSMIELEVRFKLISSTNMNKKSQKGEYLDILLRSKKTIFSTKDVAQLNHPFGRAAHLKKGQIRPMRF